MNHDLVTDEEIINTSLDKSFVMTEKTFKGQKLNKFSLGHRIILGQVREDSDSTEFFIWSTLFALVNDRAKLISLGWDKAKFRGAVLDWADSFKEEDFTEAVRIVEETFKEIADSRVTTGGGDSDPKQ